MIIPYHCPFLPGTNVPKLAKACLASGERVRVWVRGERSFSQKVLKLKGQRRQWSFRKAGEWDRGG